MYFFLIVVGFIHGFIFLPIFLTIFDLKKKSDKAVLNDQTTDDNLTNTRSLSKDAINNHAAKIDKI